MGVGALGGLYGAGASNAAWGLAIGGGIAGGSNGAIQASVAGGNPLIGGFLGAGFGLGNPLGGITSLGGSFLGYGFGYALGGKDTALAGLQWGGLLGGVGGGFGQATWVARGAGWANASLLGIRKAFPEILGIGAGSGIALATGNDPLAGAHLGMFASSLGLWSLRASVILQRLTIKANTGLRRGVYDPTSFVSRDAWMAAQDGNVVDAVFGKVIERVVARGIIERSSTLSSLFKYFGGKSQPDFAGTSVFRGLNFDITTPPEVASHLARPYGPGLIIATYRPTGPLNVFDRWISRFL